jgi:hypothetical protein
MDPGRCTRRPVRRCLHQAGGVVSDLPRATWGMSFQDDCYFGNRRTLIACYHRVLCLARLGVAVEGRVGLPRQEWSSTLAGR